MRNIEQDRQWVAEQARHNKNDGCVYCDAFSRLSDYMAESEALRLEEQILSESVREATSIIKRLGNAFRDREAVAWLAKYAKK